MFLILSLPRSRSTWLSRFLSYRDWWCGHDELRHMRSLDDVKAWFSQGCTGSAETAAAPFWRLIPRFAPDVKIVTVRRPVAEVVESLMHIPGVSFDRGSAVEQMSRLDRKLDQIEARLPNVLSVRFADLASEETCARVFEHCLPYKFDPEHWRLWDGVRVQCDMSAMMRYVAAFREPLERLAGIAKQQTLASLQCRTPSDLSGMTFQTEDFDSWERDGSALFKDHCALVGERPDQWERKNIPLMRRIWEAGAMQIMTARCNGRMFGYLMTLIAPSLTSENLISATQGTFYASPDAPGLGMKLERAAIAELKKRKVGEVFFEAGSRGSGPRLGLMYRRLGAVEHGQMYRLELAGL